MNKWLLPAWIAVAGTAVLAAEPASRPAAERPNVVIIVADDLGYADLGCQGGLEPKTPHIDSLAAAGTRFTDGYVTCPVCSPTRAGLVTGRYQQRFGHEFNPGKPNQMDKSFGLPLSEATIADRFKRAGYVTGMVGKWHLGLAPEYHPLARGFGEYFGFLHGSHSYVNAQADKANLVLRGREPLEKEDYLTEAFTREATGFIDRHAREPFLLYLAYNAVHNPLEVPERYRERFKGMSNLKRQTMLAMLAAMDDGVGSVLERLQRHGLQERTLVFFISDNGGPTATNTSRNDPFRGFKGQVLEGGIRVPFLVQWKGRLPGGQVYRQPVISLDILPTAMAAAGIAPARDSKLDGVDLLPHLQGRATAAPHELLCWRFGPQAAVRKANWKLIRSRDGDQLYDLAADMGEGHDLAADQPQKVAELVRDYEQWDKQLAAPLWKGVDRGAGLLPPDRPAVRNRAKPPGQ